MTGECSSFMYNVERFVSFSGMEDYAGRFRDVARIGKYCKECGNYGKCWTCPPFYGNADAWLSYSRISIIAVRISPRISPLWTLESSSNAFELERRRFDSLLARLEGVSGGIAFYAGSCNLCRKECARIHGLPCRHPGNARLSLEAAGFDVAMTLSCLFGIELKWGTSVSPPEYYVLVGALAYG